MHDKRFDDLVYARTRGLRLVKQVARPFLRLEHVLTSGVRQVLGVEEMEYVPIRGRLHGHYHEHGVQGRHCHRHHHEGGSWAHRHGAAHTFHAEHLEHGRRHHVHREPTGADPRFALELESRPWWRSAHDDLLGPLGAA